MQQPASIQAAARKRGRPTKDHVLPTQTSQMEQSKIRYKSDFDMKRSSKQNKSQYDEEEGEDDDSHEAAESKTGDDATGGSSESKSDSASEDDSDYLSPRSARLKQPSGSGANRKGDNSGQEPAVRGRGRPPTRRRGAPTATTANDRKKSTKINSSSRGRDNLSSNAKYSNTRRSSRNDASGSGGGGGLLSNRTARGGSSSFSGDFGGHMVQSSRRSRRSKLVDHTKPLVVLLPEDNLRELPQLDIRNDAEWEEFQFALMEDTSGYFSDGREGTSADLASGIAGGSGNQWFIGDVGDSPRTTVTSRGRDNRGSRGSQVQISASASGSVTTSASSSEEEEGNEEDGDGDVESTIINGGIRTRRGSSRLASLSLKTSRNSVNNSKDGESTQAGAESSTGNSIQADMMTSTTQLEPSLDASMLPLLLPAVEVHVPAVRRTASIHSLIHCTGTSRSRVSGSEKGDPGSQNATPSSSSAGTIRKQRKGARSHDQGCNSPAFYEDRDSGDDDGVDVGHFMRIDANTDRLSLEDFTTKLRIRMHSGGYDCTDVNIFSADKVTWKQAQQFVSNRMQDVYLDYDADSEDEAFVDSLQHYIDAEVSKEKPQKSTNNTKKNTPGTSGDQPESCSGTTDGASIFKLRCFEVMLCRLERELELCLVFLRSERDLVTVQTQLQRDLSTSQRHRLLALKFLLAANGKLPQQCDHKEGKEEDDDGDSDGDEEESDGEVGRASLRLASRGSVDTSSSAIRRSTRQASSSSTTHNRRGKRSAGADVDEHEGEKEKEEGENNENDDFKPLEKLSRMALAASALLAAAARAAASVKQNNSSSNLHDVDVGNDNTSLGSNGAVKKQIC